MLDVAAVFVLGTAASYLLLRRLLDRVFARQVEQPNLLDWVLDRHDWVVLKLETTSLKSRTEIVEIAVLGADGRVLLNQLVMPRGRIRRSATALHGLERKMLKDSPTWPDLVSTVARLLKGRPVVAYDAKFNQRALDRTSRRWDIERIQFDGHCAMHAYARHRAVPHAWRRRDFQMH